VSLALGETKELTMNNDKLLEEILETQKQQVDMLGTLLESTKKRDDKYKEYLDDQVKNNEEYRQSLDKSAENITRKDADQEEAHELYKRNAQLSKFVNYIRILSSIGVVGLLTYIVVFGIKVN
jgi:hypothetical protein